ncbi:MAG: hypothetical protein M1570_15515 [Chloroflexi bacterium]|nr:hypothetical protein [Chloroflexota bacterium]
MKPLFPRVLALVCLTGIVMLGCRTADMIAVAMATPTRTATRVPLLRPTQPRTATFTPSPTAPFPTITALPTITPFIPTVFVPPPAPTRPPVVAATRFMPPPTPVPPPPTPDPQAGYYYHYQIGPCVSDVNTRIQGTVYDDGKPVNGITVRVTGDPDGPPITEMMSGVDPTDPKHKNPALTGKYRLGIDEGGHMAGYWYVFIVSTDGVAETAKAVVHTDEGPGCNIATVDWIH